MPFSPSKRILSIVLATGSVIIMLALLYKVVVAHPAALDVSYQDSMVHFEAARDTVLLPFDCVYVRWSAEAIDKIFLDGKATIGSGEQSACLSPGVTPTLRVDYPDGTSETYPLTIAVVTTTPSNWLLLIAAVIMATAAWHMWHQPETAMLSWRWVEQGTVYSVVLLMLALLIFRADLSQFPLMRTAVMSVNLEEFEQSPDWEQLIAEINGDANSGIHIKDVTPPDAVVLVPFRISHSMVMHTIAYPRKFYWVGDLEAYLQRYTSRAGLSGFLPTAVDNAARLGYDDFFADLYLLLESDQWTRMQSLDLDGLTTEIIPLSDSMVLARLKSDLSVDELEAAADAIVSDKATPVIDEGDGE